LLAGAGRLGLVLRFSVAPGLRQRLFDAVV